MNDNVFYENRKQRMVSNKFDKFKQSTINMESQLYSTYNKADLDKFENKISNLGRSKQYLLFLKQLDRRQYNLDGLAPSYIPTTKSQLPQQQYQKIKVDNSTFKSAFMTTDYGQQNRPKASTFNQNTRVPARQRVVTEYVPFNESTHFSQALQNQRELNSVISQKSKSKDQHLQYYEKHYLPKKNKLQEMTLEQQKGQGISKLFNKNETLLSQNMSRDQQDEEYKLPNFNYLNNQDVNVFELPNIKVDQDAQYLDQNFDSFKQNQEKEQKKQEIDQTQRSFKIGNESETSQKSNEQDKEIKNKKNDKDYIVEQFDEIKIIQITDMKKQLEKFQPQYDLIQQSIFNNNLNKKNFHLIVEQDNPQFTMILDEENENKLFLQFLITPIKEFSKQELQKIQESQTQSQIQLFENNLTKFLNDGQQEFYIISNYINQNNEAQKFISQSKLTRPLQILKRFVKLN